MTRILSIDPSSTKTGWALVSVRANGAPLVDDSGVLSPVTQRATVKLSAHERSVDLAGKMLTLLDELLGSVGLDLIVIESPGRGMAGRMRKRSGSLATYAFAAGIHAGAVVGRIRAMPKEARPAIRFVPVDQWGKVAGRSTRKGDRALLLPKSAGYDASKDGGLDQADAIELAFWMAGQLQSEAMING